MTKNSDQVVEIFTDGACRGNPGPGGWGALLQYAGREKKMLGAEAHTTNNRMELIAVISALASLKRSCQVAVTTDSQYVRQGITQWLQKWQQNGWLTSARQPVKNSDLWRQLAQEAARHHITWHWVRGHSGASREYYRR